MTAAGRVIGTAAVALALAACSAEPRAFIADQRLRITAPAPMAVVSAPFAVTWTTTRQGDASYALFVDHLPVPPGHSLRDLATDQCKAQPGCPDATYLAAHGVYLTTSDTVDVPTLPTLGGTARRAAHPAHTLTVIALDARGRRRGDAAWALELRA
ncbi:MAG: hypothetical protein ACYDH6_15510 [Acidimicrobiales bacterium]